MAKLFQTLIPVLSSIALLLAIANTAWSQTTSFTYDFYGGPKPTDLLLQGDANFPSGSTYLRLTRTDDSGNPLTYRVGRAVYSNPITFWLDGAQPVGSPIGFTGGSFGIFDESGQNPSTFAVEFDIFTNPGVDPSYPHVGIDIESNVSKNTTDVGDALIGQEVTARIDYEEATKVISVHVTAGSKTFEVSYVYDLSTILPQQVEVGISATTGGQVAVHDLISWYFTSTLVHTSADRDAHIRQYV
ncbi:hypothetical protein SASPL_117445 [Salvia splendens]|uniref:Legume lectin domain-containing protein n=1 Tax=Salvia splendens TaxID=180675 RepID=A0A8X8Y0K1_SALSN|nr:hypothetical protein SASPL_117445 [Salvia splendens]